MDDDSCTRALQGRETISHLVSILQDRSASRANGTGTRSSNGLPIYPGEYFYSFVLLILLGFGALNADDVRALAAATGLMAIGHGLNTASKHLPGAKGR